MVSGELSVVSGGPGLLIIDYSLLIIILTDSTFIHYSLFTTLDNV